MLGRDMCLVTWPAVAILRRRIYRRTLMKTIPAPLCLSSIYPISSMQGCRKMWRWRDLIGGFPKTNLSFGVDTTLFVAEDSSFLTNRSTQRGPARCLPENTIPNLGLRTPYLLHRLIMLCPSASHSGGVAVPVNCRQQGRRPAARQTHHQRRRHPQLGTVAQRPRTRGEGIPIWQVPHGESYGYMLETTSYLVYF